MLAWIRKLLVHYPHTYRHATSAAKLRPRLDVLEDRLTPAIHEWTGQGVNNLWSNAANWTNGSPANDLSGDIDLVFHTNLTNAAQLTTQNDIANLVIDSITFDANAGSVAGNAAGGLSSAGYVINGNAFTIDTGGTQPGLLITAGVSNAPPNALTETINAAIILAGSPATLQSQDSNARLVINGNVNNGGQALTIDSTNTRLTSGPTTAGVELNGVLSGAGSLTKASAGSLLLSGANTYAGGTTFNGGTTVATNNSSLGAVAATTTANDPGRLLLRGGITVQQATFNLNANNLGGGLGADGNTTNTIRGNVVLMAGAGGVALGAGVGVAEANTRLIVDGVISGATSTLSLNGAGVIEFTRANTYTGLTNHNGNNGFGAVQIDDPAGLGAGGPGNETQLNRNGAGPTGSALWLNFSGTLQSGAAVPENIFFAGSGVNSTGAIRLRGDNDVTIPGNITFIAGAPWFFGVDVATATLTTTGVIDSQAANRALTKVGPGTLIVGGTAANTFQGGVFVNGGTLNVQNTSATPLGLTAGPSGGLVTVAAGVSLQLQASGANSITIPNPLTFLGTTFDTANAKASLENVASGTGTGINTVSGNIVLPNTAGTQVPILVDVTTNTLDLTGIISGPGGAITAGGVVINPTASLIAAPGTVRFSGASPNIYTGDTSVNGGTLNLNKDNGIIAVQAALVIGDNLPNNAGVGITEDSALVTVTAGQADQIGTTTNLTINADGRLSLNGANQTIGALNMTGGEVAVGAGGVLSLTQNATATGLVDANAVLHVPTISAGGTVALNPPTTGGSRTFTVNPTAGATTDHIDLQIDAVLADGAGAVSNLVKAGTGVLSLTGSNTYDGTTLISAGQVTINTTNGLGDQAAAAVTVAAGGNLRAGNSITIAKPINLSGPGYVSPFSGPTAALEADGTGASNGAQFSGAITLSDDATGNGSTVGLFAGDPGDSLRLTGVIQGTGGLTALRGLVQETGTVANTYTGLTTVNAGATLELNRLNGATPQRAVGGDLTIAGTVLVDAGVFSGADAGSEIAPTSNVTLTGGTLQLAANVQQAIGTLRANRTGTVDLSAAGSQLQFATLTAQLGGTTAGTSYDQVTFLGAVNLNNAVLSLQLGFQPAIGNSFVLIANDGTDAVTGTFAGLVEGAPVTVNGTTFAVTYVGGDGNDVALTVQSVTTPLQGTLTVGGTSNGTVLAFAPDSSGQYATTPVATLSPFGPIPTNIRSTTADVNGDGTPDTILVTGPGTPIRLAVVSGADNATVLVAPFDPFGGDFLGGGFVAAADIDRDGRAEFVVTPDQGGGPRVSVFSLTGGAAVVRANFFGIDDANFRGGARAAVGDLNGDGTPDLVVGAGFLGGPRTAIFNGTTLLGTPTRLIGDFFAFPGSDAETLRNGVFLAVGDVDGDGKADLIFGGGPGGAPRVFILSGAQVAAGDVAGAQSNPIANFFVAGNSTDRGGVRLAAKDADGDTRADVVTGSGEGGATRVRVYLGKNFTGGGEPGSFQDLDPFGTTLASGVFVG